MGGTVAYLKKKEGLFNSNATVGSVDFVTRMSGGMVQMSSAVVVEVCVPVHVYKYL